MLARTDIIRRIVVDLRGDQLVESESDSEDSGPESGSRPDLEQQREMFTDFWKELFEKYPIDDQSQPVKAPAKGTNQFFDMQKESKARMAAVAAERGGKAGVYLNFPRQPVSEHIFQALMEDRVAINEEIGIPIEWNHNERGQWVAIWHNIGDGMMTTRRAETQAWLGDVVNRFINTFRPRIESLLREQ